jgi:malonyl-CoA O-methyltransferase
MDQAIDGWRVIGQNQCGSEGRRVAPTAPTLTAAGQTGFSAARAAFGQPWQASTAVHAKAHPGGVAVQRGLAQCAHATEKPVASPRKDVAGDLLQTLSESGHTRIQTACPPILRRMALPCELDPKAVRRQFERRPGRQPGDDFVARELERALLQRLEPVRLEPSVVLDAGCGQGAGLLALKKRYPQAQLIGVDFASSRLASAQALLTPQSSGFLARWRSRRASPLAGLVAADLAALPLAPSSVDLIWSNLALHWFSDPEKVLAQWYQVIRPGGLLTFSCLGVDTLAGLRSVGARFMHFADMHDLGDALVHAGFAEPVMDVERMAVTWREAGAALRDLHALGGNALPTRFKGLLTGRQRARWLDALEGLRGSDGLIRLELELVFGHAWCGPQKRLPAGLAPVRMVPRRPQG